MPRFLLCATQDFWDCVKKEGLGKLEWPCCHQICFDAPGANSIFHCVRPAHSNEGGERDRGKEAESKREKNKGKKGRKCRGVPVNDLQTLRNLSSQQEPHSRRPREVIHDGENSRREVRPRTNQTPRHRVLRVLQVADESVSKRRSDEDGCDDDERHAGIRGGYSHVEGAGAIAEEGQTDQMLGHIEQCPV